MHLLDDEDEYGTGPSGITGFLLHPVEWHTPAASGRIGTELPATVVDVSLPDEAVNDDPTCPRRLKPCVLFLGFPQWDYAWGIADDQVQRFYLSDLSYGGVEHLFVAVIYADKAADMDTFVPLGEELLRTVQVPAAPA